jgi:predicted membrane protein
MEIWHWIIVLYVLPMIIVIVCTYFDEGVTTIGDLLEFWWAYFIPAFNLFIALIIPIYYIHIQLKLEERWEKFKNIKIK